MVRSGLIKAVLDVLSSHPYLMLEDFKVEEYQSSKKEPCISIVYRYDTKWQFRFHIPRGKTKLKDGDWERYWFNCTMIPGRESSEEILDVNERSGLLSEIKEWLIRLYEDLVSTPILRQFEAHSTVLEKLRDRLDAIPNEPLSFDDIKEFRDRLDEVKNEFADQLHKEISDKEELKQKVAELGRDIEFLKQTLESMTKRQWSEVLMVRVNRWKEKINIRQITAGARVLKMLLPSNIAQEIDTVADAADNIADVIDKH